MNRQTETRRRSDASETIEAAPTQEALESAARLSATLRTSVAALSLALKGEP